MPNDPESNASHEKELDALRRQVARLEGIETRCRKAEAALQAVEERNRLLGNSTPLGMFTLDAQGAVTGVNRKMTRLFAQLDIAEPESTNLFACPALAASGIVADIQRCMDRNQTVVVEHPYEAPQNTRKHWRHYLSPIPGSDGTVSGVMAIVEDRTDLKSAEEALKESEKRYRQLFQSAPIALIEWDVSRLKIHLEDLRASGVADLAAYLEEDPRQVHHCWSLIRTVTTGPVSFVEAYNAVAPAARRVEFPDAATLSGREAGSVPLVLIAIVVVAVLCVATAVLVLVKRR